MSERKGRKYHMRTKLLSGIFIILGLTLSLTMLRISQFQKTELINKAHHDAEATTKTLQSILELQMLNKSSHILEKTLRESVKIGQFSKICIIGKKGNIEFSSNVADLNKIIPFEDERCHVCHKEKNNIKPSVRTILIDEDAKDPLLRSISPIITKRDCYESHSPHRTLLGIFLTEKPLPHSFKLL